MAIVYNGTTFSGANTAQNIAFNGSAMCSVNMHSPAANVGVIPVFSRGYWRRESDWNDDTFHACIYRIDSDGEIYVCWWANPSATHYLNHPGYSLATNCLFLCYSYYMHAYGNVSSESQPIIIVKGTSGECAGCVLCYTLSTSQWNPQKSWCSLCRGKNPTATCTYLGYFVGSCSGTFSFYWPNDQSVGRCWYNGRGTYSATSESTAEYFIDNICFKDIAANGVLRNCYIGCDMRVINA